jgi:hypothetical protein
MCVALNRWNVTMPAHASKIELRPIINIAGAMLLALVLAGCAQQRPPGYYDTPHDSTLSDAQKKAQGQTGARAPSQIQLGFGNENKPGKTAAQPGGQRAASAAAVARPLTEAKTFLGTVPCVTGVSDCASRVVLTLAPSGEWRARTTRLGGTAGSGDTVEQGCWNVIGTSPLRILLETKDKNPKADMTFATDNVLRINMIDGNQPTLEHRLTRQADIDPINELKGQAALGCRT